MRVSTRKPATSGNKEGLLLLFQIDHLSGEEMGWILETEEIPGLRNRQLMPTLTKKGRPGYLLLLDIDPVSEEEAVQTVTTTIAVFGYHRLVTQHLFSKVAPETVHVVISAKGKRIEASLRMRPFDFARGGRRLFLESDDLTCLRRRIRDVLKVNLSTLELKCRVESFLKGPRKKQIVIRL